MITLELILTPKDLYKNLYRLVRVHCSAYDFSVKLFNKPVDPTPYQKNISALIQTFTQKHLLTYYNPSFAKQLRVYMYAYRYHRLGGVSRG